MNIASCHVSCHRNFRRFRSVVALSGLLLLVSASCGKQSLTSVPLGVIALQISGPQSADAGVSFSLKVSALDDTGAAVANFTGAAHFDSSDPEAHLPIDYAFTSVDDGSHIFNQVVLQSAGTQTISVSDAANHLNASLTIAVLVPAPGNDGGASPDSGTPPDAGDSGIPDSGAPVDPGSLFDAGNPDAGSPVGGGTIFTGNDAGVDWILQAASTSGGVTPTRLLAQTDGSVIGVGTFAAANPGGALDTTQFDIGDLSPIMLVPPSNAKEIWLAKWDSAGAIQWARRAGGPSDDVANDGQMLADGTVLITGQVTLGAGDEISRTLFFARYNSDGSLASVRFNGTGGLAGSSVGSGLATYPDGSFTICGDMEGIGIFGSGEAGQVTLNSTSPHGGVFLAHYNADQTLAWAQVFDVTGTSSFIHPGPCSPTPGGGVVVGGSFMGSLAFGAETLQSVSNGNGDGWLAAFASDGTPRWARSYPPSPIGNYAASSEIDSIEATSSGDVIVGGAVATGSVTLGATTLSSGNSGRSGFIARVSSTGEIAWAKAIADTYPDDSVFIRTTSPGPSGSFYAAGNFNDSITLGGGEPNVTTLYGVSDPTFGTTGFFARVNESDGTLELARAMETTHQSCFSGAFASAVRPDGIVLVAGTFAGACYFAPTDPTPTTMRSVGFGDLFLSAWFPN